MTGPVDAGLQGERTGLAWTRSTLAMAGNALLVMRSGITTHDKAVLAVGTVVLGLSAVVAVMGWRRHAQIVIMTRDGRNLVRPGVIRLAALAAATAAVGATIAVLR